MSRATRIEFAGAFYHVTHHGVGRSPTFRDDEDRRSFLSTLEQLVDQGVLEVHAYCLLPHQYHLLLRTPRGGLARWMRRVNGDYVRRFNYRYRRAGPLWQGRYAAILVEEGESLLESSRCIHLAPAREKLTRSAQRYRWSSYGNYLGGAVAAPWVETEAVLGEYLGSAAAYRAYVEAGKDEPPVSPSKRAVGGLVWGGEGFVARIRKRLQGREDTGDEPALAALKRTSRATPEAVETAVARVFAEQLPARKRRILLYAQRRYSRLRGSEIARRYGRTPAAVSLAVPAIEARARIDPRLAAGLAQLARILEP